MSHLVILLEHTPLFWSELRDLTPQEFIEQLLAFINLYTMMDDANRLAVFGVGSAGSQLLYQSDMPPSAHSSSPAGLLVQRLHQAVQSEAATAAAVVALAAAAYETALSAALSRALCFLNRAQQQQQQDAGASTGGTGSAFNTAYLGDCDTGRLSDVTLGRSTGGGQTYAPKSRILCISACPGVASQHIAAMNAIFSAQRSGVVLDGCHLGRGSSPLLQQAAYLTGGVYLRPGRHQALVQYLLSVFSAPPSTRQFLRLPRPTSVDLRASCFCHKQPRDQGYVCSVCLSIFCRPLPACTTCGTVTSVPLGGTSGKAAA